MLSVLDLLSLKCMGDIRQIAQKRVQSWGSVLGASSVVEIMAVEEVSKGGPTYAAFWAVPGEKGDACGTLGNARQEAGRRRVCSHKGRGTL